jgi:hypothetical protein
MEDVMAYKKRIDGERSAILERRCCVTNRIVVVPPLERTRNLMDAKTRDCLVTSYHSLIASLKLRDPEDRLTAAIAGRCEVIVTQQIGTSRRGRMRRAAPDDLLCNHFNLCAGAVPYRRANGKSAAEKPALYGQGQALQIDLEALAYRKQSTALIAHVARARRDAARRQRIQRGQVRRKIP